jgi:SNF2 family DNA or RNA helicase
MTKFKTTPYAHQLKEFEDHADNKIRANFWQMRTGKTKLIIDNAYHLFEKGKIDCVFVIAPKGVHSNWHEAEIPTHAWDYQEGDSWAWDVALKHKRLYKEGFKKIREDKTRLKWFCFSSNSLINPVAEIYYNLIIKDRKPYLIFDESHDFRTPTNKGTKKAIKIADQVEYKRILTGTPMEQSPLNLWSQFRLLSPDILGPKYSEFQSKHAIFVMSKPKPNGRSYPEFHSFVGEAEVKAKIAPFTSLVLRSDCEDLPETIIEDVKFELTPEQKKVYKQIVKTFTADVDGERITMNQTGSRLIKLQQVTSGYVVDERGDRYVIPGGNPRLETFKHLFDLNRDKRILVWAHFRSEFKDITTFLAREKIDFLTYNGESGEEEREAARKAFHRRSSGSKVQVLIAHRKSAGAGTDFSQADIVIDYSHTFNNFDVAQANERAVKMGGENVHVKRIVSPGIDEYILKSNEKKSAMAENISRSGLREVIDGISLKDD